MILVAIICVILIPVILFRSTKNYTSRDETEKTYFNADNSTQKTIIDIKLQLTNKTIRLSKDIDKLKKKQQKILNQFAATSDYGEQSNSSIESKKINK